MELQGKIALVTGASRRIGREIALALGRAGADLALHYFRSAQAARQLTEEVRSLGRRAEAFQADLAVPQQIADLLEAVGAAFGHLDVLVNNAALCQPTPIDTLTPQQWDAALAVNARAAALCIHHALPWMSAGGTIVNIADAAITSRPDHLAYCASKAALLALTANCAVALAPRGIRVNAVSPGIALWQEGDGEELKQQMLRRIPLGRIGGAESVTQAVLFLLRSDYVTAQDLRVDGGWHMG
ncbi:MAG: SDR family oxidoreductase [Phycisphaerae bacterium]|nr:SDR family oxidoreductase [Phycisphaerae bacterium]